MCGSQEEAYLTSNLSAGKQGNTDSPNLTQIPIPCCGRRWHASGLAARPCRIVHTAERTLGSHSEARSRVPLTPSRRPRVSA
ncbi:hypothetical protein PGT21_028233 [Puccinia graminis f. sp. tritici]|uniref:Uncharacterized protein n=1 Tax=Puccinia graminis f. sp. tritici TaxID=56615 RepID=A0A5B0LYT4_PUCGR|nr:hypothetical protein PGT21_028233 [Puccinia graminis f. sp. tritici]